MLQTIIGGASDAEVASLILWVFGWVGLALVSALLGPVWRWLDPFSTLHRPGVGPSPRAWRLGAPGRWRAAHGRPRLGAWPAVGLLVFFVWLELVARVGGGPAAGHRAHRLHRS